MLLGGNSCHVIFRCGISGVVDQNNFLRASDWFPLTFFFLIVVHMIRFRITTHLCHERIIRSILIVGVKWFVRHFSSSNFFFNCSLDFKEKMDSCKWKQLVTVSVFFSCFCVFFFFCWLHWRPHWHTNVLCCWATASGGQSPPWEKQEHRIEPL